MRAPSFAVLAALLSSIAGCPADDATPQAPRASACEEASACMIDECTDELDALRTCLDAAADPRECDAPSLAVGRCVDACEPAELSVQEHDAAFAVYLCEAGGEEDCDEAWASCE